MEHQRVKKETKKGGWEWSINEKIFIKDLDH